MMLNAPGFFSLAIPYASVILIRDSPPLIFLTIHCPLCFVKYIMNSLLIFLYECVYTLKNQHPSLRSFSHSLRVIA